MHNTVVGATLLASSILTGTLAAATKTGSQFRVDQVAAGYSFRSGALATLQTYKKFRASPPQSLIDAAAEASSKKSSTSVGALPDVGGQDFLSPITVGGGNSEMNMLLDLGSSDL